MCPVHALSKFAEEAASRNCAAISSANIGEVGKIAFQLSLILNGQRHTPGLIGSCDSSIGDRICQLVTMAHYRCPVMAKRNYTCTRQGCDVNKYCRFEATGIGQRVAENESALSIGIQYLDRFARHAGNNVAWPGRSCAWQIFTGRNYDGEIDR